MNVTLRRWTVNPEEAIDLAASNCYDSHPKGTGTLMNACYQSGHHSVLEFAQFHFHIEGISRACLAQLTRHRTASFAVRSQRYVNENNCRVVTPKSIADNPKAMSKYAACIDHITACYAHLTSLNIPKEDARFVLPNACETVVDITCDLRNLIHFCNERLCMTAQWEIRELAVRMKAEVEAVAPKCAAMLVPKCESRPIHYCTEKRDCKYPHPHQLNITPVGGQKNE